MNNKSFSAEEISGLIQELDHNFSEYEDKADLFISYCNEFRDNDSYQGTNAVAAKIIVGEKEVEIANLQKGLHTKLLDMYKHVAQSFADKVDSAPNARLDLDALTISENGLKSIYGKMDDYCCKFENIAKEMQNKYGHIGNITVPDCNPLRESMINLCGGDVDNAGFLYELKQKLINFDEEECAYIENLNFHEAIDSLNATIILNNYIFNTLSNDYLLNNPITRFNNVKNIFLDNGDDSAQTLDIFKVISNYIKEKYGFTDEQLIAIKNSNYNLLILLYVLTKCESPLLEKKRKTIYDKVYIIIQDDAHNRKREDSYSKRLIMPERGSVIEVSLGENHVPPVQKATVLHDDTWSTEFSVDYANKKYPASDPSNRVTRVLNYLVDNYETNYGTDGNILTVKIPEYDDICYVGVMVDGFANPGDVVKVTLDAETLGDGSTIPEKSFYLLVVDVKNKYHEEEDLKPEEGKKNWQCQNYWGHGYMTTDLQGVQICPCEFVTAGKRTEDSAKNYTNMENLLTGRYVKEAEIVGSIYVPD